MGGRLHERSGLLLGMAGLAAVVARPSVAEAGPRYSLGRKAACAEKAVEVEIVFARSAASDRLVERAAAGRRAFPARLRERAMAGARVTASFYEERTAPPALPKPLDIYLPDRAWRAGYERGRLRALLFVRRQGAKPMVLFGVEGVPTDVDADYAEVRAALVQYARWRHHPGDAGAISEAERTLASTSNAAVATLASAFLCAAGHADAIARASRSAAPSAAAGIDPVGSSRCPPPVESCSDW